jgi:glycosyltransferase involved in cell wall biosynthesis
MDGSTISFANMVEGLKNMGVETIVIYPNNSEEKNIIDALKNKGIKSYPCRISYPFAISSKQNIVKSILGFVLFIIKFLLLSYRKRQSFLQLEKLVNLINPDIIHTNVGVVHEGYKVAKKYKIPHCWHLREYQDKDFNKIIYPTKNSFIKKLKQSCVITITHDIQKHFNLENYSNATTIYNGILPASCIAYESLKEKYFLCASRVSPEKGHVEVINAFAKFCKHNNDYKLIIAGFGDIFYIDVLKQIAKQHNCIDKIEFVGYQENIYGLMKKATALIVASQCEGFGRMTAEASFCGCLVIGNNTGGTKEILEYTGGGILYSGEEELINSMSETIKMLSSSAYSTKVLNAQKKATEMYSIEQNIEQIYHLYNSLIV